ncbi:hypothetical protein H2200_003785 [Cladophialophora chaetospira]|uniref:Uncharacterized protein n=1 Tax=Cladophialophora chaetospira TaxID=386627 RepID=A0AA38XEV4_9EURO|nr:hypothetical protein H2200_003785 [Cladophialophora chaetospira]
MRVETFLSLPALVILIPLLFFLKSAAMRVWSALTFPALLILLPLLFFFTITSFKIEKVDPSRREIFINFYPFFRPAVAMYMNKTNVFVPANHPNLHYVGRWVPSANHLRRDAAFPGSYVEAVVTDTTSVYLVLNNVHTAAQAESDSNSPSDSESGDRSYVRHIDPRFLHENRRPAKQVSLMVEIEGKAIFGVEQASSILRIASDLDPRKTYRLKITHMGCHCYRGFYDEVLEFEGLWLDRPALPRGAANVTVRTTLGRLISLNDERLGNLKQSGDITPLRNRPVIELVTSERPNEHARMNEWHKDIEGVVEERVGAWYKRLGSRLSADVAMVPLERATLLPSENEREDRQVAVKDLFFRSGPEETANMFARPWNFASYQPAVLILQFGLVDFVDLFADKEKANKHTVSKFTDEFVDAYVRLVHTIRSGAYAFQDTDQTNIMGDDGSYIYNSAPSTLPIFLIPPFSSRRRLVTRKLTLHKFISDALAQVVARLHAEGDKSTHRIDTTGWLDPKIDFDRHHARYTYKDDVDATPLTAAANVKVAALLADHICPYIKANGGNSTDQFALGDCVFDQYESYLGNVYLPKDVQLDRAVLERKIESIKQKFKLDGAGLDGRGRTFLHKIRK